MSLFTLAIDRIGHNDDDSIIVININKFLDHPRTRLFLFAFVYAALSPFLGSLIDLFYEVEMYEFTEEFAKVCSLAFGYTFAAVSTFIFAVMEMVMYISDYGWSAEVDGMYWNYFFYRMFCVVDHMGYLGIHMMGKKIASNYESLNTRLRIRTAAFAIAWAYHLFHNIWLGEQIANNLFNYYV